MSEVKGKKVAVVLASLVLGVSTLASAGQPKDFGVMKVTKPVTNGQPKDFGVM